MNFTPKYTITNKLLRNIKDINKLVVELNNKRFPKPILYQLDIEARQLSTYSSTSIEGNNLTITQIKKLLKERPKNIKDTEREILNYNEALEFLNKGIKEKNITLNNLLILKTHKLVTQNLLDSSKSGKYRYNIVRI